MEGIKEVPIIRDGEESISRVAELKNEAGELTSVWLASITEKELVKVQDFDAKQIYIQSLGLKNNKKCNRKYYDFDIINMN